MLRDKIFGFAKKYFWFIALLSAVAVINPIGEFPLNDDWVYARSVRYLLEHGALKIPDCSVATLLWQTLWGGSWSVILGNSFSALRLSTLALSVLAAVWFGKLAGNKSSLLPAVLSPEFMLLGNPFFFLLSFTFMTDVPYLSWLLLALWLYVRAFESDVAVDWLLAAVAASLAYLVRQLALPALLSVIVALIWRKKLSLRRLLFGFGPLLLTAGIHWFWFNHVQHGNWASHYYVSQGALKYFSTPANFIETGYRVSAIALYASFFVFPLALLLPLKKPSVKQAVIAALLTMALVVPLLAHKGLPPYYCSLLTDGGFGPLTLLGDKYGGPMAYTAFWAALWLVSIFSLLTLILNWRLFTVWPAPLLALCAAFNIIPTFIMPFSDRYIVGFIVPFMASLYVVIVRQTEIALWRMKMAALASCMFFIWSFAYTWDYMNWNRAKHEIARQAVEHGLAPDEINNGFDWSANIFYERNMELLKSRMPLADIGPADWIKMNKFSAFVSFSPMASPAWELAGTQKYFSPPALGYRELYLYKLRNGKHATVNSF